MMALVAAADENINDSEVITVQELYVKQGSGLVNASIVRKAVNIVVTDQAEKWQQLSVAKSLSREVRKDIFGAALQFSRADSNVHEYESALLIRLGKALNVPQSRLDHRYASE
jgi:uncharacterized tellurite resistance protein B-like protein